MRDEMGGVNKKRTCTLGMHRFFKVELRRIELLSEELENK